MHSLFMYSNANEHTHVDTHTHLKEFVIDLNNISKPSHTWKHPTEIRNIHRIGCVQI